LPAALALRLLASRFPAVVERGYSTGLYPEIAASGAWLAGRLPFSLAEWLSAAFVLLVSWRAVLFAARAVRRKGYLRQAWLPAIGNVVIGAGVLYLSFLLVWGLNYAREPFAVVAGLDASPPSVAELRAACVDLVQRANALRDGLPEDSHGVMRLKDGLAGARGRADSGYREAAAVYAVLAGRSSPAKPMVASRVFSYLGITGIFFPWTGEPNVNADVPDPDLPFAIAHEMAHARGFAREDEAGYVGYLACRFHADADFRYSGALAAGIYALNALAGVDRAAHRDLADRRSPAVRRDLRALQDWSDRYSGRISRASRSINNAYLRSQGQAEGVRSYGRMVDLLVAERRARPGGPVPRDSLGVVPSRGGT
jgi:uncharacterized protein DUF3810